MDMQDPRRVTVFGNLTLDIVLRGVRNPWSWGREVEATEHAFTSGGQGYQLVRGLANFGVPVSLVSCVGDDEWGRRIVHELSTAGVASDHVRVIRGATPVTVAAVRVDGERAYLSDFAINRSLDVVRLLDGLRPGSRLFCIVGSFNLPSFDFDTMQRVLADARRSGTPTLLDTGWDPAGWPRSTVDSIRRLLADVDIFLPNLDEATAITGHAGPEEATRALCGLGSSVVAVKCGADGSYVGSRSEVRHIPPFSVDVRDAVGAGDVFNAGFIYQYLETQDPWKAGAMGNAAASLYVSGPEREFPDLAEAVDRACRLDAVPAVSTDRPGTELGNHLCA